MDVMESEGGFGGHVGKSYILVLVWGLSSSGHSLREREWGYEMENLWPDNVAVRQGYIEERVTFQPPRPPLIVIGVGLWLTIWIHATVITRHPHTSDSLLPQPLSLSLSMQPSLPKFHPFLLGYLSHFPQSLSMPTLLREYLEIASSFSLFRPPRLHICGNIGCHFLKSPGSITHMITLTSAIRFFWYFSAPFFYHGLLKYGIRTWTLRRVGFNSFGHG